MVSLSWRGGREPVFKCRKLSRFWRVLQEPSLPFLPGPVLWGSDHFPCFWILILWVLFAVLQLMLWVLFFLKTMDKVPLNHILLEDIFSLMDGIAYSQPSLRRLCVERTFLSSSRVIQAFPGVVLGPLLFVIFTSDLLQAFFPSPTVYWCLCLMQVNRNPCRLFSAIWWHYLNNNVTRGIYVYVGVRTCVCVCVCVYAQCCS